MSSSAETLLPGSSLDLARQYLNLSEDSSVTHRDHCDYPHRNPPRRSDCDCGAFDSRECDLADLAEKLVAQVIVEHAT